MKSLWARSRSPSKTWWLATAAFAVLLVSGLTWSATAIAGHLTGSPATYTLDADFDEGSLINVEHDPSDQLQLDDERTPLEFLWVAVSTRGTIVKIDTTTGVILGEYQTAPDGRGFNPSRTTVDNDGNVWVANRNESGFVAAGAIAPGVPAASGAMGSITKVGLLEAGECVDKNSNGTIETSTGQGDIKAWTNAGGADTLGGVSTAEDECILHYTRVNSYGARHISVTSANDVWVSGTGDRDFDLVDGDSGAIITQAGSVGYGGYGGLIDGNGVIWSARNLLRWDTSLPLTGPNGDPAGPSIGPAAAGTNWAGQTSPDSYGTCINPNNGEVWVTTLSNGVINRYAPDGTHLSTHAHGNTFAQGCVVDGNGHVWVAHSILGPQSTVGHLDASGAHLGNVTVGSGPTGVAVDAAGKVWSANYNSRTASRIDPALAGGVGAVDLTTVDLLGNPYNYSDMTGSTLTAPADTGTWTVVHDTGVVDAEWGDVSWTADTPGDSALTVTAQSSTDGSTWSASEVASNGGDLSLPDGQYLRVVVKFDRASSDGDGDGINDSPILYDLTITAITNEAPDCTTAAPSVASIWPPNHKMVPVGIEGVTDADGDEVTITITGITQDEALNDNGDGNFEPDGSGVGTDTAEVRAERTGDKKNPGDGRVYEISFEADDGNGGSCSGSVQVGVPHDQAPGNDPVDSGQAYDSTGA